MKLNIKSMLPEEIGDRLFEMGQPKYRSRQIFKWLSRGCAPLTR